VQCPGRPAKPGTCPQDVTIEYRWAEGHYDRLLSLAAELVTRKVDAC
jgi:hypothetical protein